MKARRLEKFRSAVALVAMVALLGIAPRALCDRLQEARGTAGRARILYCDSSLTRLAAMPSVSVTVQASASYSAPSRAWTYTYLVANDRTSTKNVETFAIAPIAKLQSVTSPAHWEHLFYDYQGSESSVVWAVFDVGQLPPGYVDTGNVPPSEYAMRPGSICTFGFTTLAPPLPSPQQVTWYAQEFDTLPHVDEVGDDYVQGTIFTEGVTGTAIGPDEGSLVGEGEAGSDRLRLHDPRPNSARNSATIGFELPIQSSVQLAIYDSAGRRERLLVDGAVPAGMHSVSWNGMNESGDRSRPGYYDARLLVDGKPVGRRRVTILP